MPAKWAANFPCSWLAWQPQLNRVCLPFLLLGLFPGAVRVPSAGQWAGGRSSGVTAVLQRATRRPRAWTACERAAAGSAIRTPGGLGEARLSRCVFDPCLFIPQRAPGPQLRPSLLSSEFVVLGCLGAGIRVWPRHAKLFISILAGVGTTK